MTILPIRITYCSWSRFKKEEWDAAKGMMELDSMPGRKLAQRSTLSF
jgi:hypothetical protein